MKELTMMLRSYIIKVITMFILLIGIMHICAAQNKLDDLENIVQKYSQSNSFLLKQQLTYFNRYDDKEASEIENNILVKKGNKVYYKAFNQETIISNDISVWIDNEAKIMLVDLVESEKLQESFIPNFQAIESLSYKSEYKEEGNFGCYIFHFKIGEHTKSEIWYNKKNFEVSKIVYYMREAYRDQKNFVEMIPPPRVEIQITEFNTTPQYDEGLFDLSKYILPIKGNYKLNDKYKDYKLINNIQN